uniref:Uncharacterized protein n=1 Tax=Magallana gigas TaxID=29159 RepID=K1PVG8_MAGGI
MAMDQLLVLLVSFVYVVHACGPDPRHDQSVYCNSQYEKCLVSNVEVVPLVKGKSTIPRDIEVKACPIIATPYSLRVLQQNLMWTMTIYLKQPNPQTMIIVHYQPNLRTKTIHPRPWTTVCLERFAANKDPWTNQPRIKALHSVDQTKRLRNYDCYCKIDLKLPRSAPVINNVPKNSKCELTGVTDTCAVRNGYCGRDWSRLGQGACKWFTSTCS